MIHCEELSNKTKESITKMDSITAMIFSPKARPIRLLLLDGMSVLPVASTSTLVASRPMTSVSEVRHQLRQVAAGGSSADWVIQIEC
jgi:hypothetical protein